MRILQVHTRYRERGGEDAVVDTDRELLLGAGHEVQRYEARNPDGAVRAASRLALAPWNPVARRELRLFTERFQPDVAHVHNTWFSLSPSAVAGIRDAGVPIVMTVHNYRLVCSNAHLFRDGRPCQDCVGSHPWHGVVHRCYRDSTLASFAAAATIAVARRGDVWSTCIDRFLVLNDFGRDILLRSGVSDEKIVTRPNVVTDHGVREHPPSTSPTVIYVGRLSETKGIRVLLDAWRRADPSDLRLDVFGDGELREELMATAPPTVRFHGWVDPDEIHGAMRTARALAFPTLCYEGQPLVVLEALAAGLPILASDLGGTGDDIRAVDPQGVLPAGDVESWAEGLRALAGRSDLDDIGSSLRRRYERLHTPEVGTRQLEAALGSVVGSVT